MNVTVFGGAQPLSGEKAYIDAMRLGRLLGAAGHTVLTGGYIGTMEAVSRGAAEAGGLVVGVTCEEIDVWRKTGPNPWVMEVRQYRTLRERMYALIDGCDAALALPGGVGTLAEIAVMWNQLIVEATSPKPLILIGLGWQSIFEQLFSCHDGYVPARARQLLSYADDVEEAANELAFIISGRE